MGDDEAGGASKGTMPSKAKPKGATPNQGAGMLGFGPQSFLTLGAASKVWWTWWNPNPYPYHDPDPYP